MGERRVNADVRITEAGTFQQAVQARRAGTWGALPRRGAEAGGPISIATKTAAKLPIRYPRPLRDSSNQPQFFDK